MLPAFSLLSCHIRLIGLICLANSSSCFGCRAGRLPVPVAAAEYLGLAVAIEDIARHNRQLVCRREQVVNAKLGKTVVGLQAPPLIGQKLYGFQTSSPDT